MAHGFLSYQDTRGEVDWLGKVIKRVNDYLENREKKEKVADMVAAKVSVLEDQKAALPQGQTPLLKGGNDFVLEGSPLQRMLADSTLAKATLPGAMAVNPSVMGGPLANAGFGGRPLRPEGFVGDRIVDIGATNLGVERDLGGDDMFVKRLNTIDDGVGGGSD
jgi:hypothetical protein